MTKYLGIDIGSLTVKAAIYDTSIAKQEDRVKEIALINHRRQPLKTSLHLAESIIDNHQISGIAFTGGAGKDLSDALNAYYVSSELASVKANMVLHPELRTILTLGASSSYLIRMVQKNGKLEPDIALPPNCSAGTGSFLEQAAGRFGVSIEEFAQMALQSDKPVDLSAICAVFMCSDMIDRQQKGVPKIHIARGAHEGVARHLVGTLGKGKKLQGPYSFQGGVAENPAMVRALENVLSSEHRVNVFIPHHNRFIPAIGAAMIAHEREEGIDFSFDRARSKVYKLSSFNDKALPPLSLKNGLIIRKGIVDELPTLDGRIPVYIGIDVGSVSTNLAVLYFSGDKDWDWKMLFKRYIPTQSNPLEAVTRGLREINEDLGDKIKVQDAAVTGSGRKLIAEYLGGVKDVNEITAHKTASLAVADREGIIVDEIFEIGGQDSKYIKLKDGIIECFDMNKSCAAGTGSFTEEQAKLLGVRVESFASKALKAKHPVSFGTQKCTVFIEEEVAARQSSLRLEDLLASVAYAVADNYLNQFKIGDRRGKTIFFQGGMALNQSVAAALQHKTNAKITVPEHNEAMGAIGAAIVARKNYSGKAKFIGLRRVNNREYTLDSFKCKDCVNHCEVSLVETNDGAKYYSGDRCEKYAEEAGQKKKKNIKFPDLFQIRNKWLRDDYNLSDGLKKGKIGIPRVLSQYYDFFPLWKTFFEQLGYRVITSGRTNQKIVEKGIDNIIAETCFPAELAYGHLKDLIEKNVDYIFFPSIIETGQTRWIENKTFLCTLSQNDPFTSSCSMPELDEFGKFLLRPAINMHQERYNLDKEMIKTAKKIGHSRHEAVRALRLGLDSLSKFQNRLEAEGKNIFLKLKREDNPVIVVGRSYTLFDKRINVNLPKMILESGGFPIPLDFVPLKAVDIRKEQDLGNWSYYHKIVRAAEVIRKSREINGLFFSVFACGPDAFLADFFKYKLGGKAHLDLEVGKTSAPAHYTTRVEAFMDSIKEQRYFEKTYRKTSLAINVKPDKRILFVPNMNPDARILIEALKVLGIESRLLPYSTPESLALANRHISEKTCLPARMTGGDYIHFLETTNLPLKSISFFNNSAGGACRQRVYFVEHQMVIKELGYGDIPVITPLPGKILGYAERLQLVNGGKSFSKPQIVKFFKRLWEGAMANEALMHLVRARRPYEIEEGSVNRAYNSGMDAFCREIERGRVKRGALELYERIMQVPVDESQEKANIGILGEGYVRLHEFSNRNAVSRLEAMGARCFLPESGSYLNYIMENTIRRNRQFAYKGVKRAKKFMSNLFLMAIRRAQHYIEHEHTKHIVPHLFFHDPDAAKIIDEAEHFLDTRLSSEAVEGIGLGAVYAKSRNIHGILNIIPAHCMAGSVLQMYLERLYKETGIPMATISVDGRADKGFFSKLEILMAKSRAYKNQGVS